MNEPLVSVIVPVYNVERFLVRCINSLLDQSHSNLEIILVNDGSSDSSRDICSFFKEKDERVLLIDKPNGGLSDARNVGIDAAKGDFLCFVDSDDYVHRDFVKTLLDGALQNEADVCVCNFEAVDEKGVPVEKQFGEKLDGGVCSNDDLNSVFLSGKNTSLVVAWNKIYRRACFASLRYPLGRVHEDEWTTYKILYSSARIAFVPDTLYFYVQRFGSITMEKKHKDHIFDAFYAFVERHEFAKKQKNKLLQSESLSRCISELRQIVETYDFSQCGRQVLREFRRLLFKGIANPKQWFYKAKLFRKIVMEKAEFDRTIRSLKRINSLSRSSVQHIVMLGTPTHNNLGDHAIAYAERVFWQRIGFSNQRIFEFQTDTFFQYEERIFDALNNYSITAIDGGGNIGSLWPNEHKRILSILSNAKKGKLIMFPETVSYSPRDFKTLFLRKDKAIFEKANCLYFLRDKASYSFFSHNLQNTRFFLSPDIVFSLINHKGFGRMPRSKANKVVALFRTDKEGLLKEDQKQAVCDALRGRGFDVVMASTISPRSYIKSRRRRKELKKLFRLISRASLVVTDRLHGMIFSFIQKRKCFALNNINGKVEGSYQWISNNPDYMLSPSLDAASIINFYNSKSTVSSANLVDFSSMEEAIKEWIEIKE